MGQLIDVILHDGGSYLGKIDIQANTILRDLNTLPPNLANIAASAEKIINVRADFAQLFKRIEPFGGRKRGRPKQIIVESVIKNQFLLAHRELTKLDIVYTIPDTKNVVICYSPKTVQVVKI